MRHRSLPILAVALVAVIGWLVLRGGPGSAEPVSERFTEAEVVFVEVAELEDRRIRPARPSIRQVTVRLALDDGGEGVLLIPPPAPALGDRVPVRVVEYADGSRRLSIAGP